MLRRLVFISVVCVAALAPATLSAQTVTYHLHKETGAYSYPLRTVPPDAAAFAILTPDLKNTTNTAPLIAAFESAPDSINNGTIPAGATFTASVWLRKSSTASTVFPTLRITTHGAVTRPVCNFTGTTALTTTITKYILSCASSAPVVIVRPVTFYVTIGGSFSVLPGNQTLLLGLHVEGVANGNYDSQLVVSQPVQGATISSLDRTEGIAGESVVVSGSGFGGSQGSNGLTFNGAPASVTSWSASTILANVPAGATPGDVVAWIDGRPSNGIPFTVFQPPVITSLTPGGGSAGQAFTITGTSFGATQGTSTVTLNGAAVPVTNWTDTTITGTVPAGASSGLVVVTAYAQASNGVMFVMTPAGTSTTYHLHKEASTTTGRFQLKSEGPDGTSLAIQSLDLKNQSPGGFFVIKEFDTQAGVTSNGGLLPMGSPLSFTLWMKATSAYGTLVPRIRARLNSAAGAVLCEMSGGSALTTTLTPHAFTCAMATNVLVSSSDRIYLSVGVILTVGPGHRSVRGELDIEGTLNGNYDSRVGLPAVVSAPTLTALDVTSGAAGQPVAISGMNFGAVQDFSTVTFNGLTAAVSSWSDGNIVASVPAGAATGPVVVTRFQQSNPLTFTVLGSITGMVRRAGSTQPIAGAVVQVLQSGQLIASAVSSVSGGYLLSGLPLGTYEVTATKTGTGAQSTSGVTLTASGNVTLDLSIPETGQVNYGYDALNRLVSVTNGNGGYARYSYDAVGNLLSILREGVESVQIFTIAPLAGPRGSTVNISGRGFSPDLAQNAVLFNGVAATIIQSTATQLTVIVPVAATTGALAVTTPSGSATGTTFAVFRNPTITSFSPTTGPVGTSVTVTGTDFDVATPVVKLNGSTLPTLSATATTVTTTIVQGSSSGPLSVTTPEGTTASTNDFVVVPSGYGFSGYPIVLLGRTSVGQPTPVSLASGAAGYLLFDATGGQRISLTATNVSSPAFCPGTATWQANLYLFDPTGVLIGQTTQCDYVPAVTLSKSGTYQVVVTYAQAATVTVHDVTTLADQTATIAIGGSAVEMLTAAPAQLLRWRFDGIAGQPIALYTSPAGIIGWCVNSTATLRDPAGAVLASFNPCTYQLGQGFTLPSTGTYTLTSHYYGGEVGKGLYVRVRTP